MENKLKIEQLKNYLGTGLKLLPDGESAAEKDVLIGIYQDPCLSRDLVYFGTIDGQDMRTIQEMKPICYRLSDLDKFIPELGFVPIENLYQSGWSQHQITLLNQKAYTHVSFNLIQILFQWHFWPFGDEYFEKGLVIDKFKHGRTS